MKRTLQLQGLDCAACAAELEREIAAIGGVVSASIAFVNQKLTIEYDNEETLQKAMDVANSFEEVHVIEDDRGMSALKKVNAYVVSAKSKRYNGRVSLFACSFLLSGFFWNALEKEK